MVLRAEVKYLERILGLETKELEAMMSYGSRKTETDNVDQVQKAWIWTEFKKEDEKDGERQGEENQGGCLEIPNRVPFDSNGNND